MKPREVIARALYRHCMQEEAQPEGWYSWLGEADAVIDALEKMEITDAMYAAWASKPVMHADECWSAMVGAMREPKP